MDLSYFGIEKGSNNSEELQDRIDIIIHKLKFFPEKPKVALLTWGQPLMLAEGHLANAVEIAGGESLSTLSEEEFSNPEVIIFAPENLNMEAAIKDVHLLLDNDIISRSKAVQNNRFYIADGQEYFSQKGTKAIDALEILAEIITPKYFSFGFENKAWVKFEL
mgnify:CR=1 FL=1